MCAARKTAQCQPLPPHEEAARRLLVGIPGIGNALAAQLVRRGVRTRAQLREIVGELPREAQANLRYNVVRSIPRTIGKAVVAEMKRRLTFEGPNGRRRAYPATAVGGIRRNAPTTKDIDVLVVVPNGTDIRGVLPSAELRAGGGTNTLAVAESYASGQRRHSLIIRRKPAGGRAKHYGVDLFLATAEEKPFALFHYSGGRSYNIRVRALAKRKNLKLDQYGLFVAGTKKRARGSRAIRTERGLARFLGITYRPPESRAS